MSRSVSITSYADAHAYLSHGRDKNRRPLEWHTVVNRRDVRTIAITYHQTDVVTYRDDGAILLNSGGWRTQTTKNRINEYSPLRVTQHLGVWYVTPDYIFADGMVYYPHLNAYTGVHSTEEAKRVARIKRQIAKYVKGYMIAFDRGDVGEPDSGDCWDCAMVVVSDGQNKGKSLGEAHRDTTHLVSHMEQRYYVPSLLARAIKRFPVSIAAKAYISDKWAGTSNYGPNGWGLDIARDQLRTSLRRYLSQQFDIAA